MTSTINQPVIAIDEAVVFSMRNTPLLEQGTSLHFARDG